MTLKEYLTNPLGKGDSSLPGGKLVMRSMEEKYFKLDQKKGRDIKLTPYYDGYSGDVYMHIIIPSETERDNTYDVVIRFFDQSKSHKMDLSIANYDVQFFTNDPSFVYTHAYVYREYGLLIAFLEDKLGKEALTKPPVVRNQFEVVSYDKYLFFGAKYVLDGKNLLNKAMLQMTAKPFSAKLLYRNVRSAKKIMEEYEIAEGKLRQDKKYKKDQENKSSRKPKKLSIDSGSPIGAGGAGHKLKKTAGTSNNAKSVKPLKPKRASGNRLRKR